MTLQEIRTIAKTWGVNAKVGRAKRDIIRDIQCREGNSPCFGTVATCSHDCLWKQDCLVCK